MATVSILIFLDNIPGISQAVRKPTIASFFNQRIHKTIQPVEKVYLYKNRANSLSLTPNPFPVVKGCVCLVGFASLQSPWAYTPGIRAGTECGAAAPTKQGRLQSVAQSRCTTQRHQRLTTRIGATPKARMLWLLAKSFALCKTNRASNAKHPFSKIYRVFGRLKQFSVFINRSRYSATASQYKSPIGPFLLNASRYICVQS